MARTGEHGTGDCGRSTVTGLILTVVSIVVLAAVAWLGAGWLVADRVVRPRRRPLTRIVSISSGVVELEKTPLSSAFGPMGLLYDDETRHVRLGAVVQEREETVLRELESSAPGLGGITHARVVSDPFGSPANAGLVVSEVDLYCEERQLPAWRLHGEASDTHKWAIHIHGAMSARESMLRTAHSMAPHGYTSLIVQYRGDGGGPNPLNGSTLGQMEWRDIEPAVEFAIQQGAKRIVLVGMSLGATIALSFVDRSSLAASIDGMVLVAPILNWSNSIRSNVQTAGLPPFVAGATKLLLSKSFSSRLLRVPQPIQFDQLDFVDDAVPVVPTLILHTKGDRVAPFNDSVQLASRFPDLVTLQPFEGQEHALEWNSDTALFEGVLGSWLMTNK